MRQRDSGEDDESSEVEREVKDEQPEEVLAAGKTQAEAPALCARQAQTAARGEDSGVGSLNDDIDINTYLGGGDAA